jgi:predicted anti-sigma-YlaC factor YlaD
MALFTCQELVELVTEYLEGQLSIQEQTRFEAHLNECEGCRNYLDQMRWVVRLNGHLRQEHLPTPMRERLLATFKSWQAEQPAKPT